MCKHARAYTHAHTHAHTHTHTYTHTYTHAHTHTHVHTQPSSLDEYPEYATQEDDHGDHDSRFVRIEVYLYS